MITYISSSEQDLEILQIIPFQFRSPGTFPIMQMEFRKNSPKKSGQLH